MMRHGSVMMFHRHSGLLDALSLKQYTFPQLFPLSASARNTLSFAFAGVTPAEMHEAEASPHG